MGLKVNNANAKCNTCCTQRTCTQALALATSPPRLLREAFQSQEIIAIRFSNASVSPRQTVPKSQPLLGFPLRIFLPYNNFLERRVIELKRKLNANVSFTPKFLQINSPPASFLYFFCIFLREFVAAQISFCNSHALLGESRGYCTKTKQEWPDSGSTLENIFCNSYEINSSQDFFCIAKILVLMVSVLGTTRCRTLPCPSFP